MNHKIHSATALCLALGAGACWAQGSTVTLYGIADAGVRHASGMTAGGAPGAGSTTSLNSGILSASRWGLRGSEELGGGLKADFNVESAIALDTGAQGNSARYFDRASWVGLSGAWGSLRAGRQTNLLVDALIPVDPFGMLVASLNPNVGITALSQHGLGVQFGNSGQATAAYRVDNALKYSGKWGPVSASVMHGFGEMAERKSALSTTGALLKYEQGGFVTTLALQRFESAAGRSLDAATLGGAYRTGRFTAMANFGRHKAAISDASDTTQKVLTLGGKFQATPDVTLTAAHYRVDRERTGLRDDGFHRSIVLAEYAFSRRTRVYAEADFTQWRNGYQGAGNESRARGASVGIVHMF